MNFSIFSFRKKLFFYYPIIVLLIAFSTFLLLKVYEKKSTDEDVMSFLLDMYGDRPCFRYIKNVPTSMFEKNGCLEKKFFDRPTIMLIGDSHSASLSLGLKEFVNTVQINMLQISSGWCQVTNNDHTNIKCDEIIKLINETIKSNKPDLVIINADWVVASRPPYFIKNNNYFIHLKEKIKMLHESGVKDIILIGQVPTWKNPLRKLIQEDFTSKGLSAPIRINVGIEFESLDMDIQMREVSFPEYVEYISLKDVLCNVDGCLTKVERNPNNEFVVWDKSHLSVSGSNYVVTKAIQPLLVKRLKLK